MPKEACEGGGDDTIRFGGRCGTVAEVTVPPAEVERWPFPRGLVTQRNEFSLLGPDYETDWSDEVDICDDCFETACTCGSDADVGKIKDSVNRNG